MNISRKLVAAGVAAAAVLGAFAAYQSSRNETGAADETRAGMVTPEVAEKRVEAVPKLAAGREPLPSEGIGSYRPADTEPAQASKHPTTR